MPDKEPNSEQLVKDARHRYLLAHIRVYRQAIDEIGTLLKDGHIDEDTTFEMLAELRKLGVPV